MLEGRYIHKSVMNRVRAIFASPPVGFPTFTVYNEDDLRLVQSGTLNVSNVAPKIFILEAYSRPVAPCLPMAIIETAKARRRPYELGNWNGRLTQCNVHIIGRMEGERKDLADFVAKNLGVAIPIYDYLSGLPVYIESGVVEDGAFDIEEYSLKRDELRQDSSLDLWSVVSFAILTSR